MTFVVYPALVPPNEPQGNLTMLVRLSSPTQQTFFEEVVSKAVPAIIEDPAISDWHCQGWTDDYLAEILGERTFQVNQTPDGKFGIYSKRSRPGETMTKLTFRELLRSIDENDDIVHYMEQVPLNESDSGLLHEIDYVEWMDESEVEFVNLWYSQRRSRIPLHWDSRDNVFIQVRGAKSIRLYDPSQTPYLYPGLEDAEWASRVDLDHPDLDTHPRFADAKPAAQLRIEGGEALYIPRQWWHYVITESEISLSVNYWYQS